jgi:hypothetical protein
MLEPMFGIAPLKTETIPSIKTKNLAYCHQDCILWSLAEKM